MADAAPTQAVTAQKKAGKKVTKPKPPPTHPMYKDMVAAAIKSLNDKKGSSRQAILKYIISNYKGVGEEKQVNVHVKMTLKRMVENGQLTHVKGKGAAGSFRFAKAPPKTKKKAAPKKPKAKKSPAAKKKSAAKPKKSPSSKKAAKKSPKKPKKPIAKPAPVSKKSVSKKSSAKKSKSPAKKGKKAKK